MAPTASPAFVAAMEDVLEVYHRPYNPEYPVVCMDESNKQLISHTYAPLQTKPGMVAKEDHEYKRQGVRDIFMATEPLAGKRYVSVTTTRTQIDWAYFIRDLVNANYKDPVVKKVVLVMDNLNTHVTAALYAAFPPEEALRLSQKLEIHYTPKHGSWLNIAECELSVLSRQCLNRRIATEAELVKQVQAWTNKRNETHSKVDWQFTTEDARVKLKHLYPSF
jgi:hypothetical protein